LECPLDDGDDKKIVKSFAVGPCGFLWYTWTKTEQLSK